MKKLLLVLVAVAMLLPSCKKIEESIDALENRIDKLEQETIPTIDEQIAAIQTSIKALEEVDESLDESIKALEANDEATAEEIAALQDADAAIEAKIEELKKYVDDTIKSTKDWVSATFATLEQLNALSSEVAVLKSLVDANKAEAAANLANAISNLETSLKKWVGEQLSNYYTIAEIDAKIANLEKAIADGDKALQEELNTLKSQLEFAKKELTEAYKKAIEEAITENNGVINTKIASEIAAVNKRIDEEVAAINAKIATLQAQVDKNTEDIAKLLARIQSVSYVPQYSDGKALVSGKSCVLDFKISPKECVVEMKKVWEKALSCEAVYTKSRAGEFIAMPITQFGADAESGVITVTASCENLSEEFFAGTQEASVALVISDGNNSVTSEYVPIKYIIPTNEIWYTSTDGAVVEPYATDVFGANIVSNTYENGLGVIKFDGDVTKIGYYAFLECKSLKSITIPDSVTSIGYEAFYDCTSLASITIPDSVTEIRDEAFRGCTSLTAFYEKFASADNRCLIVNGVLNSFAIGCGATEYTIPDSVTSIGMDAFRGCTSLTSVTIPNGVTSIGYGAFCDCTSLTSVTIPNGVTSIGQSAFGYCTSLTSITIPDSVTWIGPSAFHSCTSLTNVTIPDSVTEIRDEAFRGCTSLTSFYGKFASTDNRCLIVDGVLNSFAIGCGATEYTIPDSVTSIGGSAFSGCTSLTSVTIPDSVTWIGDSAFEDCTSLTSVTIPDGVTEIESFAFENCTSLTSITIPDSVTSIGRNPFTLCVLLKAFYGKYASEDNRCLIVDGELNAFAIGCGAMKYTIPNSVTEIGYYAFYYCTSLASITIPDSVTSIGNCAFYDCASLKDVYCQPTTPPTGGYHMFSYYDSEFNIIPIGCKIYVPIGSGTAYKTAEYWSSYAADIVEKEF